MLSPGHNFIKTAVGKLEDKLKDIKCSATLTDLWSTLESEHSSFRIEEEGAGSMISMPGISD